MIKLSCTACIAIAFSLGPKLATAADTSCQTLSTRLLDHLDTGDFAGATNDFDDRMKAGLGADKLGDVWQSLPQQFGARGARGTATVSMVSGDTMVVTPLHYGDRLLDAQVACGSDGKIAGFYLKPGH